MGKNFKKPIIFFLSVIILYGIFSFIISNKIINHYQMQVLIVICINIILALSLNLIIGFTGQLALGHAGFMSIGAYTAAILTINFNAPFIISLLAGGLLAALAGFVIGLPTLRLKGDYFAITTLGFGEIIRVIITNIDYLGGARGISGIPPKTTFSIVYLSVIITFLLIYNIVHSSKGRAMISIREDEIAAEAMGINTTKYKIEAFVIGSFLAGVAGGLYAHYYMYIDPTGFNFMRSVEIVTYVVLGGMGSLTGCIFAAGALTLLPEVLRSISEYRMVIYSFLLIVIMIFRPQGLMGNKELSLSMFKRFKGKSNNKCGGHTDGINESK